VPVGETAFYPLVENHHRGGILRLSLAPAPRIAAALQREAGMLARRVLEELDYVGVLAMELLNATAACSQMKWRRAFTIPAIGRSKARHQPI